VRRRVLATVLVALAAAPGAAQAASPPDIVSPEAIVIEAQSGDVAYAKDPDGRRPIASTTKLMTALLTLEHGGLKDTVTVPRYRAAPGESVIGLIKGEQITEADLLRGLLVYSANDAAVALATQVAGNVPSFVRMMNRRAEELGLTNTHYANPIGLDAVGNYSSARDLASLTLALRKHRFFRRTVNTNSLTLTTGAHPRTLVNRNTLLANYPWIDGVKTGYTSQAGNVLVSSGTKRGVHLVSVVIGAASKLARNDESLRLLDYAFPKFRLSRAIVAGDRVGTVPIDNRPGAELPVVASRSVARVKRRTERFAFHADLPKRVAGPIHRGEKIGQLAVLLHGRTVASIPLTAALEIPRASAARRTQDFLTRPWTLIVLGVILVLAAMLSQRRPASRPARSTEESAT
jgi:D-alanyl-D-alanine carboxypeptidase (penicillin-binding protein 5/6)